MGMTLLAFTWFTRDHGLFVAGLLLAGVLVTLIFCYEKIGWLLAGLCAGAALMYLVAHLFHLWR